MVYKHQMWRWYRNALKKRPLRTNVMTAAGAMAVGDTLAQYLERTWSFGGGRPDSARLAVAVTWNGAFFAPSFFLWFRYLDSRFPGASLRSAIAKTVANQVVMVAPINAAFICYSVTAESLTREACHHLSFRDWSETGTFVARCHDDLPIIVSEIEIRLRRDLTNLVLSSAELWMPLNLLNFLLVPTQYRVLPTILGSIVWSTYISWTTHRAL